MPALLSPDGVTLITGDQRQCNIVEVKAGHPQESRIVKHIIRGSEAPPITNNGK